VAKCQGPRVGGGALGHPTSRLKTLKIYLYANVNYLKIFIYYLFVCLMEILIYFRN
jgi:hypothetical protein